MGKNKNGSTYPTDEVLLFLSEMNLDIFRNGKPAKEGVSIGFHLVYEVIKSINITFALQL
ncbi:MAG: hypothetical protein EOM73_07810 [Bacteroidia bacterium]|nr:hypothetical protein [Bacteroidia bacterium]